MTQLILDTTENNFVLPETMRGAYNIREVDLGTNIEMISGRTVKEIRGRAWEISYQYGYFDTDTKNKVLAACEKGKRTAIRCGFLPQESDGALSYSSFIVTSVTRPKFMWSRLTKDGEASKEVPMWADFYVELREVRPHD